MKGNDNIKHTIEYIQTIFNEYNVFVLEYINSKNIIIIDEDGFKYKAQLYLVETKKKLPHKFRQNPFVLENINTYLNKVNSNLLLLSKKYINCKTKLEFICSLHSNEGSQYISLDDLLQRTGSCKYCSYKKQGESQRIDTSIIINRCIELNLTYVDRYNKNQETCVTFICNNHPKKGIQHIIWCHLKTCSVGCSFCAGRNKTTEDFREEMKHISPDIQITGEYGGSEKHVECKCLICQHVWHPIGRSLKSGQGCPACSMSKGERCILKILNNYNIPFLSQHTFKDCSYIGKLKFDFYLPDHNILIEYDGEQHFFPVDFANKGQEWAIQKYEQIKMRDKMKDDYCANNNIRLIRIPYTEFDLIEKIIETEIIF